MKQKTRKSYDDAVLDILGGNTDLITMLSNPLYFLYQMSWQERRKILCDIAGELSYSDIIAEPEFKDLADKVDVTKVNIEDFKKHCANQISILDKQKSDIPVKLKLLDELNCETLQINFPELEKEKAEHLSKKATLEKELDAIKHNTISDDINAKYHASISDLQAELISLRSQHTNLRYQDDQLRQSIKATHVSDIAAVDQKISVASYTVSDISTKLELLLNNSHQNSQKIESIQFELDNLRLEFRKVNAEEFTELSCPTCNRLYDPANMEAEKLNFEQAKNAKKESINARGKSGKAKIEELINESRVIANRMVELEKQLSDAKIEVAQLSKQKTDLVSKMQNSEFTPNPEIEELSKMITELTQRLSLLESEKNETISKSLSESGLSDKKANISISLNEIEKEVKRINELLGQKSQLEKNARREKELLAEEAKINEAMQEWEHLEYLAKNLIRAYMSKVEESVNSKFKLVKFKLFEELQNKACRETCIATVLGVPQNDINTASKTNAGIDIINTLSAHYGINLPIIVDNRESITTLMDTESQIINLYKVKGKSLQIEI